MTNIDSYKFGVIVINGKQYTKDVIIYKDKVDDKWWRKKGHLLQCEDLESVFKLIPDILIIGTGAYGMMDVHKDVSELARTKGIQLIIEKTEPACTIYNELSKSHNVIAALHLTC
jgi:hypothetical protein